MTMLSQIPMVVVTGFLGSGKTTLLRRWQQETCCRDAVMIVQDFSELGVDAELLSGDDPTPPAGALVGRIAALHGVHAKEQLHVSMGQTLAEIRDLQPPVPLLFVESTGAARPLPLWLALTQNPGFFVRHWIVVVDALNLHRDFADGKMFTGSVPLPTDPSVVSAATLLVEQLLFANVIVLTKTDAVNQSSMERQIRQLRKLQPHAAIACSARAGLSFSQLEPLPPPQAQRMEHAASLVSPHSPNAAITDILHSLIVRDNRPFHPQRLFDVCRNELTTGLYRAKGFLWLASRSDFVLLWQQSGSQVTLELMSLWRAGIIASADDRLVQEERAELMDFLATKDPDFGDRHNEITLIGLPDAIKHFAKSLMEALCTPAEIVAWKNGATFPDPWPTKLIKHL